MTRSTRSPHMSRRAGAAAMPFVAAGALSLNLLLPTAAHSSAEEHTNTPASTSAEAADQAGQLALVWLRTQVAARSGVALHANHQRQVAGTTIESEHLWQVNQERFAARLVNRVLDTRTTIRLGGNYTSGRTWVSWSGLASMFADGYGQYGTILDAAGGAADYVVWNRYRLDWTPTRFGDGSDYVQQQLGDELAEIEDLIDGVEHVQVQTTDGGQVFAVSGTIGSRTFTGSFHTRNGVYVTNVAVTLQEVNGGVAESTWLFDSVGASTDVTVTIPSGATVRNGSAYTDAASTQLARGAGRAGAAAVNQARPVTVTRAAIRRWAPKASAAFLRDERSNPDRLAVLCPSGQQRIVPTSRGITVQAQCVTGAATATVRIHADASQRAVAR